MDDETISALQVLNNIRVLVCERQWCLEQLATELQDILKNKLIGKLVKFSGKGWNVGYVVDVRVPGKFVSSPIPIEPVVYISKEKGNDKLAKSCDLKLITFLSEPEIADYEKSKEFHEKINKKVKHG